jgi:hypothetical protein
MKAYVEKAVPLKGADTISIMLTVPKSEWLEVSKLVMQDIEIGLATDAPPVTEPETVEEIERRLTGALSEVAVWSHKLITLATARQEEPGHPLFPEEKKEENV